MHRADAATVSDTEIVVTPGAVKMRYEPSTPCDKPPPIVCVL
jgi:hypothetical protein